MSGTGSFDRKGLRLHHHLMWSAGLHHLKRLDNQILKRFFLLHEVGHSTPDAKLVFVSFTVGFGFGRKSNTSASKMSKMYDLLSSLLYSLHF